MPQLFAEQTECFAKKNGAVFSTEMAVEFTGWALAFYYPAIPEMLRANLAAATLYRLYDVPTGGSECSS